VAVAACASFSLRSGRIKKRELRAIYVFFVWNQGVRLARRSAREEFLIPRPPSSLAEIDLFNSFLCELPLTLFLFQASCWLKFEDVFISLKNPTENILFI
jgi:hypothetical protein